MQFQVHGRRAYAYTGGKPFDPTLPCIVFVHGALHDHSVWTLLARWAAHHGRCVLAIDQPGHGRSEGPPLPDVEALADWTLAVLDAADVQQAALVGHSMGSLIALESAARAPERITQLVMIGTAYPMKVSPALFSTATDDPRAAIHMVNALSFSTTAAKPSYPGPGTWLHGANEVLMQRMQQQDPERNLFLHDFGVCDRYTNGLEAARNVQCPVSFILGERDQMTSPKQTQAFADALKARVTLLPGGHSLMQEVPDAVLNALRVAIA
jgi:pimeloyl-ACP methyl ester carboxylesterase